MIPIVELLEEFMAFVDAGGTGGNLPPLSPDERLILSYFVKWCDEREKEVELEIYEFMEGKE